MKNRLWWQKRNRIIQYNLQAKDADKIDAEKLAEQTEAMGANAIVINAADSYTWYPSKYTYLSRIAENRDFVAEYIEEFHKRGMKVIMRYAVGLGFEDDVYNLYPQWAARQANGEPMISGEKRPGLWRLLYRNCPNSYFEKTVAKGMFRELLTEYDVDGMFIMGGPIPPCWCDRCRMLYRKQYRTDMPDTAEEIDPTWKDVNMWEFLRPYREIMDELAPGKPLITNYFPVDLNMGGTMDLIIPASEIDERAEFGHWLCAESQDIFSDGQEKKVGKFITTLKMKVGRSADDMPDPIALLHDCPGMDWRHVGLPSEEYISWCAQAGANGAQLWISCTGVPDTMEDKRITESITAINQMYQLVDPEMDGVKSAAKVLVINDGGRNLLGWGHALIAGHIDFDVASMKQLEEKRLEKYALLIIPKGCKYEERHRVLLETYMEKGGKVIIEGTDAFALQPVLPLLGIADSIVSSESLRACYARIETGFNQLMELTGNTALLPFGGVIGYCDPAEDSEVLLTLVPPFTPAKFSGSPAERASLPVAQTDIPLSILHKAGEGALLFIPGELGWLYRSFGLKDYADMIIASVDLLLPEEERIQVEAPRDVLCTTFRKENELLIHLVNFVGERPIQERICCHNIKIRIPESIGKNVWKAEAIISGQPVCLQQKDGQLTLELGKLEAWEMLKIIFDDDKESREV